MQGFDPFPFGTNNDPLDQADLVVAAVTFIGCLYIVPLMLYWWFKLKASATNLRPLILGIAAAKFGIGFWTGSQIWQMMTHEVDLPLWSLPARVVIMLAVIMHVWVTARIKPVPKTESLSGPFHT